jgi:nucleotide-binding universal stress UspA family protein
MGNVVENSNPRYLEGPHPQPLQRRAPPREAHAIHRILVCIDRSALSDACLQYAVAISKSLGSAMTLLHVMQPPHERPGVHATDVLDWEISRQEAGAYMEGLEREGTTASGRHVDTRLEQGHPAERITAVARELDADLTVLGGHGEHGAAAWNLGSTVLQVLAVIRASVLIARSHSARVGEVSPQRILVPLDGSLRTESVLPTAVRIAKSYGAELLLALVVREPVHTAVLHTQEDLEVARELATRIEASGERYLEGLRDQLVREGASVRTLVLRSPDEKQSLLDLSQKERSDLIVLSAHGATCNSALTFGSVTAHLLTHSVVPLLVLQDLRDSELRGQDGDERAPSLRGSYPPAEGV